MHEALEDEVVVAAFIERGEKLVAHFVRGLAADVVAFEQDLSAAAGAHHAVAEVFESGVGVSGTKEDEDGGGEDEGVNDSTDSSG